MFRWNIHLSRLCLSNILFRKLNRRFSCCETLRFFRNQDYLCNDGRRSTTRPCRTVSSAAFGSNTADTDVAIVGGGIMGCATAFFLSQRMSGERICVIERDKTYRQSSTVLSACSIRQQFSLPENIQMAMFGYEFISKLHNHLSVEGYDTPDVQFKPAGYLFLSTDDGADILQQNYQTQRNYGANVTLLSPSKLKDKYPWLNTDGVALASLGLSSEGYFDAYSLLSILKKKIRSLGVQFIDGEVCNVLKDFNHVTGVQVHTEQGVQEITCKNLVNAAGAWSRNIAELAGLVLPVEARKRMIFVVNCPKGPQQDVPMIIDPSGVYVRNDGGQRYVTGKSPPEEEDEECDNLDVDYDYFMSDVWPSLAARIPVFEELKVISAWAGFYEVNTLDHNAILGQHTNLKNFYFINGFSGHGLQQAPAAGRAISELILDGKFQTIDLSKFCYERVIQNNPVFEKNII